MTFEKMGLDPSILRAILEIGFLNPMPIQTKTIQLLIEDPIDLIALAQTGTGKTAAYSLPLIQWINVSSKKTQAIILTPTRELCLQVSKDIERYSKYTDGLNCLAVYGGANIEHQIKTLRKGVHIIVGTPGRVNDLIRRKHIDISEIRTLVLDEADEMLTMGFKEELDAILSTTPKSRQTLLFSATMPDEIVRISKSYMRDPIRISAGKPNSSSDQIEHNYYMVKHSNKYMALKRITDVNPDIYGIIFCRTREETKELTRSLARDGYKVDALHGDISQPQREVVLNKFRERGLQLLVATDVAARGIDIQDITHVINFTLPDDPETYIHRCGRTGRAGKTGISIIIATNKEINKIHRIEKVIQKKVDLRSLPSNKEIYKRRLFTKLEEIESIKIEEEILEPFLPEILERFSSMDKTEVIKLFLSMEFQDFFKYYKEHRESNLTAAVEPFSAPSRNKRKKPYNSSNKNSFISKQKERRKRIKRKNSVK